MNNDDPRITAYALGELSGAELEDFENELAASPETEQAVREIRATADCLREGFGREAESGGLTDAQKEAVLAGSAADSSGEGAGEGVIVEVSFWRRTRRHVLWAGSAAAAVLCVLFVVRQEEAIETDSRSAPSYEGYRQQAAGGAETGRDDQGAGFNDAITEVDASEIEMTVTVRSEDRMTASPGGKREKESREIQGMPALRLPVKIGDMAVAQEEERINEADPARLPEVAASSKSNNEAAGNLMSKTGTGSAIIAGDDNRRDAKLKMKPAPTAPAPTLAPASAPVVSGPAGVSGEGTIAAAKSSLRHGKFDADKVTMAPIAPKAAAGADESTMAREPGDADGVEKRHAVATVAATVPAWKNHTRIDAENGPVTDVSKNVMVFEDNVRVDHAAFDLGCDTLKVFLYDDEKIGKSAPDGTISGLEVTANEERRSDIKKAIARGYVVITKKGGSGTNPVGECREATYDDMTGDLILRGGAQVRRGRDLMIATGEKTVIILKADGGLEVNGPFRTEIVKGKRAGESAR